ncbi:hypothetical protein [Spiroplasma endosymbiont of Colias croceus]|uniref:hypothetical protein n=1 Tax=Spiroplasma endosymbiont of Colias croceus TaxID=3066310 RepID=UPI0030D4CFB5
MICMWTETWNEKLIQCQIKANESIDENGRAYCLGHRIKVDEINKSRHKNCINKEKLINHINNLIKLEPERRTDVTLFILKELIENGEFDNDNL